jgi:hypothetical protein
LQVNNNVAGFGGGIYTGFRSTTTVINTLFSGNDGSLLAIPNAVAARSQLKAVVF